MRKFFSSFSSANRAARAERSSRHADNEKDLLNRPEIEAPPHYVSVFHGTSEEALDGIKQAGLVAHHPEKAYKEVEAINAVIDRDRPEKFVQLGLSRQYSIYAYPDLDIGFKLPDPAFDRLKQHDTSELRDMYAVYGATILAAAGITSFEDYQRRAHEIILPGSEEKDGGHVLELKVDPATCFVGNIEWFSSLSDRIQGNYGYTFDRGDAAWYWDALITLEEFQAYYKCAESHENGESVVAPEMYEEPADYLYPGNYYKLAGAPDYLVDDFQYPEVLIPTNIPPEHMRLVI